MPKAISKDDKNLIRRMNTKDPRARITTDNILIHPWIDENTSKDKSLQSLKLSRSTNYRALEGLKKNHECNKLKKIAMCRMAKMITDSQKDELTKRFEAIDLDKNGEIDKDEMRQAIE